MSELDHMNSVVDHDKRSKFNIPGALLTNTRCSEQLAQYVLEFVDVTDVLFAINALDSASHNHQVLMSNKWWKRLLTQQYGSSVTRWSDDELYLLQQEKLSRQPAETRERLSALPLWFTAAIHLITRLARFAHDILQQPKGTIRIPSAMTYILLIAPPFKRCIKYLTDDGLALWIHSEDIEFHCYKVEMKPHHWFAAAGSDDPREFVALYTGECYVHDSLDLQDIGQLVDGTSTRRVTFTDPNQWPVLSWDPSNRELGIDDTNMHDFCLHRGVYRYCATMSEKWDKAVAKLIRLRSVKGLEDAALSERWEEAVSYYMHMAQSHEVDRIDGIYCEVDEDDESDDEEESMTQETGSAFRLKPINDTRCATFAPSVDIRFNMEQMCEVTQKLLEGIVDLQELDNEDCEDDGDEEEEVDEDPE